MHKKICLVVSIVALIAVLAVLCIGTNNQLNPYEGNGLGGNALQTIDYSSVSSGTSLLNGLCSQSASSILAPSLIVPVNPFDSVYTASDWTAQPQYDVEQFSPMTPDGYSPTQIREAYNLPSSGGSGTIAIVDAYNDPDAQSDLNTFSNQYGLPTANFEVHMMSSSITTDSDWALETSLDIEWAHAIAPNATILLVEANSDSLNDLMSAVQYAASQPGVVSVSMSWGGSEFSGEQSYDQYFTSSTGVVFFASSGDSGAGTIYPSTSPNVIAVGGTTLYLNTNGTCSSETAWSGSGGGYSTYETEPSYQVTAGITDSTGMRAVPDVSYDANPATGVAVYDSVAYDGESGWWEVGGTSMGAPEWAAIQALDHSVSLANIYQDYKSGYSSYFRDITSGSNGGYSATTGYDCVTGLGSPITTNFGSNSGTTESISITMSYSIVGGGTGYDAPVLDYTSNGTQCQTNLTTTPETYEVDAGSTYSVNSVLSGSTSSERWATLQSTFVASSSQTLTLDYYNQYFVTLGYTINGTGTGASAPWVTITQFGNNNETDTPTSTFVDAGSYYTYQDPLSGTSSNERCYTPSGNGTILESQLIEPIYYYQYMLSANYSVIGSGSPAAPTINGTSLGIDVTLPLTSGVWLDSNSTYNISTLLPGSGSVERWCSPTTIDGSMSGSVTVSLIYYQQYSANFNYSISDNSSPVAPYVIIQQFGAETSVTAPSTNVFVDAGSSYTYQDPLSGSSANERWFTTSPLGTVSEGLSVSPLYYHQYLLNASYSVVDGGSPAAPFLNCVSLGNSSSIVITPDADMNGGGTTYWLDAGSTFSLPVNLQPTGYDPAVSNSTERWYTLSTVNGSMDGPMTISPVYYHQYLLNCSYSVIDGGNPTAPVLNSTSFGVPTTLTFAASPVFGWFDCGANYTFNQQLNSSTDSERWITNQSSSDSVAMPTTLAPVYVHQYYVGVGSNTAVGGSIGPASSWYDAGQTLQILAVASPGWQFEFWNGTGAASYSGNLNSTTLIVSSPIQENATFYIGVLINATSYGSVAYTYSLGSGTVQSGTSETIYVPLGDNVTLKPNSFPILFQFQGWTGIDPTTQQISIVAASPISVQANFGLDLLNIGSIFGMIALTIALSGWYIKNRKNVEQWENGN